MFVTSDIFDIKQYARRRNLNWEEHLVIGVAVHGSRWPGCQAGAKFVLGATRLCGVMEEMQWAGYDRLGQWRTQPIAPKSFERLVRGELRGARDAVGLVLRGERATPGSASGAIRFGGEASGHDSRDFLGPESRLPPDHPSRALTAQFILPITPNPREIACELLRLSVDLLGAEYGYYFVRDDRCVPMGYACGNIGIFQFIEATSKQGNEITEWENFVRECRKHTQSGGLWAAERSLLRDLYEINLLSARHTSTPVDGLGYLPDWISRGAGRGRLEDIGRGCLLWTLSDSEMFNVRPLLDRAGLLFSCHDRVYRDLPHRWIDAANS